MSLSCAEYTVLLSQARAALHSLRIGGQVVEVRSGEKTVKYAPGNIDGLRRYVSDLQCKVDACNGARDCCGSRFIRFTPSDG